MNPIANPTTAATVSPAATSSGPEKIEQQPTNGAPDPAAWDRRRKRTATERAFDLLIIERHYLKGKSLDDIVGLFEKERGYKLGRTQIFMEIRRLRKRWEEEAIEMMSAAKAETLRSLRRQEEELWEAWDKSKEDAVKQTLVKSGAGSKDGEKGGRSTQSATKQSSCGDPAYMRLILDIHRERARIMGFEAPQKHEFSGPDGGPIQTQDVAMDDEAQEAILRRHFERSAAKGKGSDETPAAQNPN